MKMILIRGAVLAVLAGMLAGRQPVQPVSYEAPEWEYVEWAGYDGQDGGEIDVSNW